MVPMKLESMLTLQQKAPVITLIFITRLDQKSRLYRGTIPVNEDNFKISGAYLSGLIEFFQIIA